MVALGKNKLGRDNEGRKRREKGRWIKEGKGWMIKNGMYD